MPVLLIVRRSLIQQAPCVPAWAIAAASAITDASPADVRPAGGTCMTHLLLAALYDALTQVTEPSSLLTAVAEALTDVDSSDMLHPLLATLRRTLDDMSPPVGKGSCSQRCGGTVPTHQSVKMLPIFFSPVMQNRRAFSIDVVGITSPSAFEDSSVASELAAGRVTDTPEGRRALAILLRFVRSRGPTLLPGNGASSGSTATAAKACGPAKLLKAMFYIGDKHFDQVIPSSATCLF